MIATIVLPEGEKLKVKYDIDEDDLVISEIFHQEHPVYDLIIALNILYEIDLTEKIFAALEKKHNV